MITLLALVERCSDVLVPQLTLQALGMLGVRLHLASPGSGPWLKLSTPRPRRCTCHGLQRLVAGLSEAGWRIVAPRTLPPQHPLLASHLRPACYLRLSQPLHEAIMDPDTWRATSQQLPYDSALVSPCLRKAAYWKDDRRGVRDLASGQDLVQRALPPGWTQSPQSEPAWRADGRVLAVVIQLTFGAAVRPSLLVFTWAARAAPEIAQVQLPQVTPFAEDDEDNAVLSWSPCGSQLALRHAAASDGPDAQVVQIAGLPPFSLQPATSSVASGGSGAQTATPLPCMPLRIRIPRKHRQ